MLVVVFLARLNLGALVALLAIIALWDPTLWITCRAVILSSDLFLDVRCNFVEGAVKLVEQTESAAARGAWLRVLYHG